MSKIELATSDRRRRSLDEVDLIMRNRYVEPNPALSDGDYALTARPGMKFWQRVGLGPIRGLFSQPGAFLSDLFVASGTELYRIDLTGTPTLIYSQLNGADIGSPIKMASTGDVGSIPPFLFVADGNSLFVYTDDGFALGQLQGSGSTVTVGDTVQVGTVYYEFTSSSVDTGTPNGSSGNPYLVAAGASKATSFDNLKSAINGDGLAGTDYSTGLQQNPDVTAYESVSTGLYVHALTPGSLGNGIVTTIPVGTDLSWGATTLVNGGSPSFTPVYIPDQVPVIDVAFINDFVIVIPKQGQGINGRFYWIEPGFTTVDPLNYATAERSPDAINQVIVFNDQFWLCGQETAEVWFTSPDPNTPMQPVKGITIDRGIMPGTAVHIKEKMILVDNTGGVFEVSGQEQRISTPDIEERIRAAILFQNSRISFL